MKIPNYNAKTRTLTLTDSADASLFSHIFSNKKKKEEKDYPKKLYINIEDFYIGSMDAFMDEYYRYLEEVVVNDKCKNLKSVDGVLYSKNGKRLFFCPREKKGECVVADGTEIINNNAFKHTSISKVVLPKSVRTISMEAFFKSEISEIKVNEGLSSICTRAFCKCKNLKKFDFVNSLILFEDSAFAYSGLEEVVIKRRDMQIDDGAFTGCPLKKVVIPEITFFCDENIFTDADEVFVDTYNIHTLRTCTDYRLYSVRRPFTLLHIKDLPAIVLPKLLHREDDLRAFLMGPNGLFKLNANSDKTDEISEMNEKILKFIDSGDVSEIDDLYKYGLNTEIKAVTAIEEVKRYHSKEAEKYLINNSKDIAKEFANEGEQALLGFAEDCKWSDEILMNVREVAVGRGFVTIGAYVMDMMKSRRENRKFEV